MILRSPDVKSRMLEAVAPGSPRALGLKKMKLEIRMKPVLVLTMLLMLAGCASQNENPPKTGPTKAEVQARDEFAKSLPKPAER